MTYYSKEIHEPKTKKEGLMNFLQMIINASERGDHNDALLLTVDLLDSISGASNPYAGTTDGFTREAIDKEIAAMRKSFAEEKAAAIAKAFKQGSDAMKREIMQKLAA